MASTVRVYLERGSKKVFACAADWPGWCRSGRDDEGALDTLAAYADRYRSAISSARAGFPKGALHLDVVEVVQGSATTDFGAPGSVPSLDHEPVDAQEARRNAAILRASWRTLERVAAGAPASLRKGPRGGGRDRDKIVAHVAESEQGYARQVGVSPRGLDADAIRAELARVLGQPSDGSRLREPKGWPSRYAARRLAWHALDHAWEIEDRSV
jgi:hypothetical protein